jgi:hypothetical protein
MDAMRESWTDARMDDLNLEVEELGRRMENGFNRLDADLRELRSETKDEFSTVRHEMKDEFRTVRSEMKDEFRTVRSEMNGRFEGLEERLAAMHRLMIQFCGLALTALIGFIATQV